MKRKFDLFLSVTQSLYNGLNRRYVTGGVMNILVGENTAIIEYYSFACDTFLIVLQYSFFNLGLKHHKSLQMNQFLAVPACILVGLSLG